LSGRHPLQRRRVQVLLLLLLASLALFAGFGLGQKAAYSGMGLNPQLYREMEAELPDARSKIDELQAALDVDQTRHAIDREALEMVRREIAQQKEHIANLEEGLKFYRSLMDPGEINQGLSLREPELLAGDDPATFAFRIVAQQEARKHDLLKGELYAEVYGVIQDEQTSYPLAQLSDDIDEGVIPLRFRYFQAIEGELTLPEGFEPRGISIVATSRSPRKSEVRERFSWQLQERFTHVGK
jgi:hypothetical protein